MYSNEANCRFCGEAEHHAPTCPYIDEDHENAVKEWENGFAQGVKDDTAIDHEALSHFPSFYQMGYATARREKYADSPAAIHG